MPPSGMGFFIALRFSARIQEMNNFFWALAQPKTKFFGLTPEPNSHSFPCSKEQGNSWHTQKFNSILQHSTYFCRHGK